MAPVFDATLEAILNTRRSQSPTTGGGLWVFSFGRIWESTLFHLVFAFIFVWLYQLVGLMLQNLLVKVYMVKTNE